MAISTQKHQKGEQRGGELPHKDKSKALTNLTHIPITPSLTPSSWYIQHSPPQPGSHTPCFQKKNTSLPQQERQTRNKKQGEELFFPRKRVKSQICLDLLVRRRIRLTTTRFWKKRWFQIKTKIKKGKFVLERTKLTLKKKEQNQKQTVFVWTFVLFDNDLNCLYFQILCSYNYTISGTNWWTNLLPLLNRRSSLRKLFLSPLYILTTIQMSHLPLLLLCSSYYIRYIVTKKYVRPWKKGTNDYSCVLGKQAKKKMNREPKPVNYPYYSK